MTSISFYFIFFFFQAEDGIRDRNPNNIARSRFGKSNQNRPEPLDKSICRDHIQQHGSSGERPYFWNRFQSAASGWRGSKRSLAKQLLHREYVHDGPNGQWL